MIVLESIGLLNVESHHSAGALTIAPESLILESDTNIWQIDYLPETGPKTGLPSSL